MYRASFRAEWLQRFGVGSCNCVGFGWANGGMGFGEVAQANGREEVTLAAGTVGASCRRSGPNPRIGGKAGLEGVPTLPCGGAPRESVLSEGRKCRGSQDRALRQCQLQPPLFSPYIFFF